MTLVYTTEIAWDTYSSLEVIGWADAASLLEDAQKIVDLGLGRYQRDMATGLKIDPATLEDWRAEALSNAVLYQAEYMLIKGPEFFNEEVPLDPTGPDGGQKGREPLLGPKAMRELSHGMLFKLFGRSQADFPNQNWHDYVP